MTQAWRDLPQGRRGRRAAARGDRAWRLPVLVVLVGALVALGFAGGGRGSGDGEGLFASSTPTALPTADESGALSSTWYCAAGTATEGGAADLSVVVANAGEEGRRGTVTWVPTGVDRVVTPVEVGPRSSVRLLARDAVEAPAVSAIVEMDGGDVVVEHVIDSSRGRAGAACASAASDHWYLANGTTARDAVESLVLFNPFPDDAIVDISFATEQGRAEPVALQGLLVPAGTTRAAVLTQVGPLRREVTATEVAARSGRLVVDRVQAFNGSAGRTGIDLTLAAPALAEVWTFPVGVQTEERAERWHVFNPGDREAIVSLEVVMDEGEGLEPAELSVLPHSQVVFPGDDAAFPLPVGVGHVATVRSLNGVPVVAERSLDVRGATPDVGWSSMLGSPSAAERWVLGYGTEGVAEHVAVANAGPGPVSVLVRRVVGGQAVPIDGIGTIELPPAGRTTVAVTDPGAAGDSLLTVLVEANGPVVVERRLTGEGVGAVSALGIPLS